MAKKRDTERGDAGNPDPDPRGSMTRTESSIELLHLAQGGDREALDRLCGRYMPILQRWAQGRIPGRARGMMETDDLVQETVVRTLKNLDRFEHRRDGALLAYLRTVLHNRVREEIRRTDRRPPHVELDEDPPGLPSPNALDQAVSKDEAERYEAALLRLRDIDREAIIARLEMDLPYEEVADLLGKRSLTAARSAVSRAVMRLAEVMNDESW